MAPKRSALSEEILIKLINEVKRRECLWNPDNEDYGDRFHVAKAWGEIIEILKLPEEQVRTKWKSLRDMFKKEAKKYGAGDKYRGKWRFFKQLTFIERPSDKDTDADEDNNNPEVVEIETEPAFDENLIKFEILPSEDQEYTPFEDQNGEDPIPDKKRKFSTDEDYDLMFLKSLAPYFKELDPIRKLVVRSKMQDILLNEVAAQASCKNNFMKS